jgi:hypothetical protein
MAGRVSPVDTLQHHGAANFQCKRPLAQAHSEVLRGSLREARDAEAYQSLRLLCAHLIHLDLAPRGCDFVLAGGKQAGASLATLQKGTQMGFLPDIVDHQQTGAVFQLLTELKRGIFLGGEARPIAAQRRIGGDEPGHRVGCLPQGDPQNAVIETLNDFFVVA